MDTFNENIDPAEFQEAIGLFIQRLGFEIDDVEILPDGSRQFEVHTVNPVGGKFTSIIRASPYKRNVNADDVEDLHESMMAREAVRAAYITTSEFSTKAQDFASEKPISLIDKYLIIDSVEKHGMLKDEKLMEALEKFGMGERHVDAQEQSFVYGKSKQEEEAYFKSKVAKTFLGKPMDSPVKIVLRYAPVSEFRVTSSQERMDHDQHLRDVENREYVFVNLNNLDMYYILRKRRRNKVGLQFNRTNILRRISELPERPREHLIHLLEHGDMPLEDLEGKEFTILKNKKLAQTYTSDDLPKSMSDRITDILTEITDTILIIVTEIVGGEASEPGGGEQAKKYIASAALDLPHDAGGEYDIMDYLQVQRGRIPDVETDPIMHSSREVASLLKSIFGARIEPKGIIFMPYKRCRYEKTKDHSFSKYEVLVAPALKTRQDIEGDKTDKKMRERAKKAMPTRKSKMPKIRTSKKQRPFRLIK